MYKKYEQQHTPLTTFKRFGKLWMTSFCWDEGLNNAIVWLMWWVKIFKSESNQLLWCNCLNPLLKVNCIGGEALSVMRDVVHVKIAMSGSIKENHCWCTQTDPGADSQNETWWSFDANRICNAYHRMWLSVFGASSSSVKTQENKHLTHPYLLPTSGPNLIVDQLTCIVSISFNSLR